MSAVNIRSDRSLLSLVTDKTRTDVKLQDDDEKYPKYSFLYHIYPFHLFFRRANKKSAAGNDDSPGLALPRTPGPCRVKGEFIKKNTYRKIFSGMLATNCSQKYQASLLHQRSIGEVEGEFAPTGYGGKMLRHFFKQIYRPCTNSYLVSVMNEVALITSFTLP